MILRLQALLIILIFLSLPSAVFSEDLKIGDKVSVEKIREIRDLSVEKLADATCDGVKPEATIKYPEFNQYYKLAESSREGKALEATLAHSHNLATTESTLIPTAMIEKGNGSFQVHHPADLIEVDKAGTIKRFIQSKRTLQAADLLDSRYQGMYCMTSKECVDKISLDINNVAKKSLRRGIPLTGNAAIYDEAIKSGRIITLMPDGASLPSIETISRIARSDTLLKYNKSKEIAKNPLLRMGKHSDAAISKIAEELLLKKPGTKTAVLTGVLAKNGKLIAAGKIGAETALLTFAVDGGIAYYDYCKGNINLPDLQRELYDAAVRSAAVGSATAVTLLIASTPGGLVLVAVSAGAYVIADFGIKKYHEVADGGLLKPGDLEAFGFKDEHNYSLNPSAWSSDHKQSLSPSEWSVHR